MQVEKYIFFCYEKNIYTVTSGACGKVTKIPPPHPANKLIPDKILEPRMTPMATKGEKEIDTAE